MSVIKLPEDLKPYEYLMFKNHENREMLLASFELVKELIRKHKLILTGGMAIDYAMRAKGKSLYHTDVLPDFDFFSMDHATHAYELVGQLCELSKKMGRDDRVDAIGATHPTTMRVRINFMDSVADITYMPPNLFKAFPTFEADGMLIEHPYVRYAFMHRALHLPYEEMPRAVITHRWAKDMKRFNLLWELYPIVPQSWAKYSTFKVPVRYLTFSPSCLGGFGAVDFYLTGSKKEGGKQQSSKEEIIEYEAPGQAAVVILTFKPKELVEYILGGISENKRPIVKHYKPITDYLGDRYEFEDPETGHLFEIYNLHGKLISAIKTGNIWYAGAQQVLCQFLMFGLIYKSSEKEMYIHGYTTLLECMKTNPLAQPIATVLQTDNEDDYVGDKIVIARNVLLVRFGKLPQPTNPIKPQALRECDKVSKFEGKKFDYAASEYFDRDGQLLD